MIRREKRKVSLPFVLFALLVVLSIFSLLPVFYSVLSVRGGLFLKNTNNLRSLVTAVDGYYNDYSQLPSNSSRPPQVDSIVRTDEPVMSLLAGINFEGMNPKENVYFTGSAAKGSGVEDAWDGLWKDADSAKLFDAGQKKRGGERAYILLLDYDGDCRLEDPFRPGRTIGNRAIAWSTGKDGKWERGHPKKGVNKDNVYSWFK